MRLQQSPRATAKSPIPSTDGNGEQTPRAKSPLPPTDEFDGDLKRPRTVSTVTEEDPVVPK